MNTKQIFRAHKRRLVENGVKFRTEGTGKFIYVRFELNFDTAVIYRCESLQALNRDYADALNSECHVEINLTFLKMAGLLMPHEKEAPTGPDVIRFSIYRGALEDDFERQLPN